MFGVVAATSGAVMLAQGTGAAPGAENGARAVAPYVWSWPSRLKSSPVSGGLLAFGEPSALPGLTMSSLPYSPVSTGSAALLRLPRRSEKYTV